MMKFDYEKFSNLLIQPFRSLLSIMFVIAVFLMLSGMDVFAQSLYQGPATGTVASGAMVSTGTFLGRPMPIYPPAIYNREWEEEENPPLLSDALNHTPPSAPLGSNVVIDRSAKAPLPANPLAPGIMVDFQGLLMGNSIPPDPHMAAGPNHVIVTVNTSFAIYDKVGNKLFQRDANSWFNNVAANADPFDPQIVYDHYAGRWVMVWDSEALPNQPYYLVSVSDDDDPMGDWCNYAFPANKNGSTTTSNWADYPKIGLDQDAFYISGRMFAFSGGFNYCKIRIIPKSQLYANTCGPVNYTDFWDLRVPQYLSQRVDGPPVAAVHFGQPDATYFIVDSPFYTGTFVTIWKLTDPLGSPSFTAYNVPVTATLSPPDGNQLGGGNPLIDSGRRAYRNAVYMDGSLWSATAVAGGTGNVYAYARYVRIDVVNQTALEDVTFGANGYYYLYPAVQVDSNKNMVMAFSRSGDDEYAGAYYTGRRDTDPPGLPPSVTIKGGQGNYVVTYSGTRNRWGDYMGIALDPTTNAIWSFVEYAAATNTWGTWVTATTFSHLLSGIVRSSATGDPVPYSEITMQETGRTLVTDSSGAYSFASFAPNVNLDIRTFGYRDTTVSLTLPFQTPDTVDISLEPQIVSTISGQVKDSTGNGIPAELVLFAHGNPVSGPYTSVMTDTNGFYSLPTIIGLYDIEVFPRTPFPFTTLLNISLSTTPLNYDVVLSPADVMLVDDDQGQDYQQYFTEALDQIHMSYHLWDTQIDGVPTAAVRNAYPSRTIIWFTGDSSSTPLTEYERLELEDHLLTGGKLFLTGQDIAETNQGSLLLDYLGVDFAQNTVTTLVRGVTGDVIADGLILVVSSTGGANNQTSSDVLQVVDSTTTTPIFYYGGGTVSPAAVRYENSATNAKAVFLGFGYEAINDFGRRATLMERVLNYLNSPITAIDAPLTSTLPQSFQLQPNYPNPFNPQTTIGFAVPQRSQVKIIVYNSLGQEVKVLANRIFTPGYHKVVWNGIDGHGIPSASGVYFTKMVSNNGFQAVKKMLLMK